MVKSLSEQMLDRKRAKAREAARRYVRVSGGVDAVFNHFTQRPTAAMVEEMVIAAKFGPGDPLTEGGDGFALEYIIDELNAAVRTGHKQRLEGVFFSGSHSPDDPETWLFRTITSQCEPWGNLVFAYDVEENLFDVWSDVRADEFEPMLDDTGKVLCMVDKESRAFGLKIIAETMLTTAEILEKLGKEAESKFDPVLINSDLKANDRWTFYTVIVAPLNHLLTDEERAKHGVIGHSRHLRSGKVVEVKPHNRTNPRRLRGRRTNRDEIAFLVYRVRDADGVVRYIGEGTRSRPEHVNSGCSHNRKLNEHFFLRGAMDVEIVKEHLSKDEARAVERFLIKSFPPGVLWNIKDYEPFGASRDEGGEE